MERWLSWSKAHDWKSCRAPKALEGSNPSLSAIWSHRPVVRFFMPGRFSFCDPVKYSLNNRRKISQQNSPRPQDFPCQAGGCSLIDPCWRVFFLQIGVRVKVIPRCLLPFVNGLRLKQARAIQVTQASISQSRQPKVTPQVPQTTAVTVFDAKKMEFYRPTYLELYLSPRPVSLAQL